MKDQIKIKLLENILEEVTKKYDYFIEKQNEVLRYNFELATRDKLTGLYNRFYFEDYVNKVFDKMYRYKSILILIFIDIDNFKYVNDTFGHEEGDNVLKKVSKILQESFRKHDLIVRYGGDEFIVFLEEKSYNEKEIKDLLDKFVSRIEDNLRGFKISASYGYAIAPVEADSLENLISIADNRMYEQKRARKKNR
jgi:diguanylate cyclase (GGDEF)-like protein